MAEERIRFKLHPRNVSVPVGCIDIYFLSTGMLVQEHSDGTVTGVGGGGSFILTNAIVNEAIAANPAASRAAMNAVGLTGNETVAGNKNFTGLMTAPNQTAASPNNVLTVNVGDIRYVHLSGTETIAGAKTFTGQIEATAQLASTPSSVMTKGLCDGLYVHLTGVETIAGAKTFTALVVATAQTTAAPNNVLTAGLADGKYVHLTGVETIAGSKTFSSQMEATGQSINSLNSVMTKGLTDGLYVNMTGVQTVGGAKTFTGLMTATNQTVGAANNVLTVGLADARYLKLGGGSGSIDGDQTFTGQVELPNQALLTVDSALNKRLADTVYVGLTGTQTVGGAKTFTHQLEATDQKALSVNSVLTVGLADAGFVHKTGNENIDGLKTFVGQIDAPNQSAPNVKSVLTRGLGDARYVDLSTQQTIAGNKTFNGQLESPNQLLNDPDSVLTRKLGDARYQPIINVMDFGAVGDGVANDTTKIQNAINAAATSEISRTVFFPPGKYKCNVTIPPMVKFRGANASINSLTAGIGQPNSAVCSLVPNTNATPVVSIVDLNGQEISNMEIVGNGIGTSVCGIRVSKAPTTAAGNGFRMDSVRVTYFDDGISINRGADILLLQVATHYCGRGFYFEGFVSTCQLIGCSGQFCTTCSLYTDFMAPLEVSGGAWGNCSCPVLQAVGGGSILWHNTDLKAVNSTRILEVTSTKLRVDNNRFFATGGNADAAIVRQTAAGNRCQFGSNVFSAFNNHAETGVPLGWETHDESLGYPEVSANTSMAMRYCTDATYAVTKRVDTSARRNFDPNLDTTIVEEFVGGGVTDGNVGEMGWLVSMGGAGSVVQINAPNPGLIGVIDIKTGLIAGNSTRLHHGATTATVNDPTVSYFVPWEIVAVFQLTSNTQRIDHIGFSSGVQVSGIADNFVGVRFNPAVSALFAVAHRVNGAADSFYQVTTVTGDTNYHTLRMKCLAAGSLRVAIDNSPDILIPSGISFGAIDFSFWVYAVAAVEKVMRIDYFRWRYRTNGRWLYL